MEHQEGANHEYHGGVDPIRGVLVWSGWMRQGRSPVDAQEDSGRSFVSYALCNPRRLSRPPTALL